VILLGYLAIGLALLAFQVAASRPNARVARFEEIVGAGMRHRAGRLLIVLTWWWVGFHVLARSAAVEP
jgi:Family of unknown function (DUF6186)